MNNNQSPSLSSNTQCEGNTHRNQLQTIFQYLLEHLATGSMTCNATGVPHKNFCRYKRDLELSGRLFEVEKKLCEFTGHKAWYVTTDPTKAKRQFTQLTLF